PSRPIVVHVEMPRARPGCAECGVIAWIKDRPAVVLVDLPCFGRPTRLVWHKHRWRCPDPDCEVASWTAEDPAIAAPRMAMTDRAGRWACEQVGRRGRSVAEVATELGCDWHTVNDAVVAYGAALVDDSDRIGAVVGLGLDETLFCRRGPRRTKQWCTSIVDVASGLAQLLDVVPGRSATSPSAWLDQRDEDWRAGISWGVLDLSGPYRKTFDEALPHVTQVADPFHLVKLANTKLDECRRRVQNETLGHRGRKDDPLYRARRLLTKAHERLDDTGEGKLLGLLAAGDPHGDVRTAWHAKEVARSIYDIDNADLAGQFVDRLAIDLQDQSCPPEVRSLGRTIARWRDQIVAWHRARISNGPTEATIIRSISMAVADVGDGAVRFGRGRVLWSASQASPMWPAA
ncbi:MAG TPA: ISL3 family transposase, partial [Acidimicrobiales bacterium]|nr:ISL3 family transposase [Acidimicrobiales bacterium]